MAKTIGERLRKAREQKSQSIEDVAHATRIHANTLRGLEDDDYSGFASTTYAKSFLNLYARHLEIEIDDALEQFSHNETAPIVSGANYIRSVADSIEPVERTSDIRSSGSHYAEPKKSRPRGEQPAHPVVLGLFLLLLLAVIPVLYFAGKNADTPEDALRNITRIAGGDDTSTSGEVPASRTPAVEIDARPGTRITPAAPMTRRTPPEPAPPVITDRSPPIAQADPPKQPKATPISTAPIKARPIVATPVTLPAPDDTDEESESDSENGDADDDGDTETEAKPKPSSSDDGDDQQGNGDSPTSGTATTAYRSNQ